MQQKSNLFFAKLDDTKSCYQFTTDKINNFREKRNRQVMKERNSLHQLRSLHAVSMGIET